VCVCFVFFCGCVCVVCVRVFGLYVCLFCVYTFVFFNIFIHSILHYRVAPHGLFHLYYEIINLFLFVKSIDFINFVKTFKCLFTISLFVWSHIPPLLVMFFHFTSVGFLYTA